MIVLPPSAVPRPAPAASPSGGGGGDGFRAHLEVAGGPAAGPGAPAAGPSEAAAAAPSTPRVPGPEGRSAIAAPRHGPAPGDARAAEAFLRRALDGQRHLDAAVAEAGRGRTFSAAELLGLQARLYRATEAVQLFTKTVEQTSAAVKQTLRTPV